MNKCDREICAYWLVVVCICIAMFLFLTSCSTSQQKLQKYELRQQTIRQTVASQSQEMVYFSAKSITATDVKLGVRNPNRVVIPTETTWKDVANNLGGKVLGQLGGMIPYAAIFGVAKEGFNAVTSVAGSKQGDTITTTTIQTNDEQFNQEINTSTSTNIKNSLQANSGGQISGGDSSQFESTDISESQNPSTTTTETNDSNNPITNNTDTSAVQQPVLGGF